jgi:hypothetical protein
MGWFEQRSETVKRWWNRILAWVGRNVPPGLRTVVGLIFVVGGIFSFLPVLGIWMLPLGIAIIWLDVKYLRELLNNRRL